MIWNKKDRFHAILSGELADRPLISAWRHFLDSEQDAEGLASATIKFQETYDWDFIKINPRATYFGEAWGNEYNYQDYAGVVANVSSYLIHDISDLDKVTYIKESNTKSFKEQLKTIELIRADKKEVPIIQTLFSPLAVLEYLCGHRTLASNREVNRTESPLPKLFEKDPDKVHQALKNIAYSLSDYAKNAIESGADGFFYAVLGLARTGLLSSEEYETYGKPYDKIVLESIRNSYSILHTCGPSSNPDYFTDYPIQALHWADRTKGNPNIKPNDNWLNGKVPMGGVNELLFTELDNKREIFNQSQEILNKMKNTPFILAPGCGLPIGTKTENLNIFRDSVNQML